MFFWIALKSLAVWAGILVLAVFNGAMRESVLIPKLGMAAGLVLSVVPQPLHAFTGLHRLFPYSS